MGIEILVLARIPQYTVGPIIGIKYSSPQAGDLPKRCEIRQAHSVKIIDTIKPNMADMITLLIYFRILPSKKLF